MRFEIGYAYNLDLLNFTNVLTGDEFYTRRHKDAFEQFGKSLSEDSRIQIRKTINIHGSAMLGPYLSLVISAVPNFERRNVVGMFSHVNLLRRCFAEYPHYNSEKWSKSKLMFDLLIPVIEELEEKGFRKYWRTERLPQIKTARKKLVRFVQKFKLQNEIEYMLGQDQAPERIKLFLCTFASPHGIKICGPRYISDVSFPEEVTLSTGIHEMFHPPYDAKGLNEELEKLGVDPLIKDAFETKDPKFGYPTMKGFIEENVVEAMALFICEKLGLEREPMEYLAKHDDGSHVLSVVLLDYFRGYPKPKNQRFHDYFRMLMKILPIGSLNQEYNRIMRTQKRVTSVSKKS